MVWFTSVLLLELYLYRWMDGWIFIKIDRLLAMYLKRTWINIVFMFIPAAHFGLLLLIDVSKSFYWICPQIAKTCTHLYETKLTFSWGLSGKSESCVPPAYLCTCFIIHFSSVLLCSCLSSCLTVSGSFAHCSAMLSNKVGVWLGSPHREACSC